MFPMNLLAAAPWHLSTESPWLLGVFGVVGVLLVLLVMIGKVPLSYNLLNLRVRWVTSLMTAGAFVLVIGLQTSMLAFVNGMYAMTDATGQPGNVLILSEGSTDETFSNLGFADATDLETQEGVMKTTDGKPMVSRETYLNIVQTITNPLPRRPARRFLQVRGVDEPIMSALVHGMKLLPDSAWFTDAGVREIGKTGETAIEVVLGDGIARDLGADRDPSLLATAKNRSRLDVGDTFDVGGRLWFVTGVMEATGSLYDSEIWTKQSQIGSLFGKPNYTTFVLRADPNFRKSQREEFLAARLKKADEVYATAIAERKLDPTLPKPVKELVKRPTSDDAWGAELLRDFFANEYTKARLSPQVETTFFSAMTATNQQFLIAILVLCFIMSLGGVFGVMNTMFAAISQRTRDIGVMRLLGYKRWQILVSFMFESISLAILGGLLGCALGSLADGWTASSVVSGGAGGGKFIVLRLTVDFSTIALGMLLSITMGFLGGLIPSVSAMRLTALQALQ
ncbi:MAG: ABC transporter permease [Planctomycetes bacterium]|nr:ABC transporter permease [Planctomycetota bacterium]